MSELQRFNGWNFSFFVLYFGTNIQISTASKQLFGMKSLRVYTRVLSSRTDASVPLGACKMCVALDLAGGCLEH